MKTAAVSYVERFDGRILCVWNKRYGGWSLPGGMTEAGETIEKAQERELAEETSLNTIGRELIFNGPHGIQNPDPTRASQVAVFRVAWEGTPREMEIGCPVTWLTRDEFLKWSPFASLYTVIFQLIGS